MNKTKSSLGGKEGKTYLIIYKDSGKFYTVKGIDAYIMSNLFGYKVVKNKCGFPDTIIERVVERLKNEKITHEIVYSDKNSIGSRFKFNTYEEHYQKALKTMDINNKIELIEAKLKDADIEKLEKVLDTIDEIL